MGEDNYCDTIIWVGQSYASVLCEEPSPQSEDYCYLKDETPKRCYVHEAEWRGCCRKIPGPVDWLIPCSSRVFLASHADGTSQANGLIFGYFVFKRFEHIISEKVEEAVFQEDRLPWIEKASQEIISNVLVKLEHKKIKIVSGKDREFLQNLLEEQIKKIWTERFQEQITKGYCITPKRLPEKPREWPADSEQIANLPKFLEDILESLVEDWSKRDEGFNRIRSRQDENHAYVSHQQATWEASRHCSKRLKIGATYIVDGLTANITDAFSKKLAKGKPSSIEDGEALFKETVREIKKDYKAGSVSTIDWRLRDNAVLRSELVLFNTPYPIFERKPKAEFRGLLRIDGDYLISQIEAYYRTWGTAQISYYSPTTDILYPPNFAKEFGFTIKKAGAILQLYGDPIRKLSSGATLKLPGVGEFSKVGKELHFKPN